MRYACDTYEQGNPSVDEEDASEPAPKPAPVRKPCTYEIDEPLEDPFP